MADPITPANSQERTVFAYAAPVSVRANGGGTDELLALAKERALDPAALDEFPPFFFKVTPSTDRVDSYFTKMSKATLQNYAADFAEGRAFQDSHRHDELPIGHSLTGLYVAASPARVDAEFFVPRGVSVAGDAAVAKIRTGAVRDVSIGFYGGQWLCSICGRDMLTDWDCWHFPGMSYEPDRAAKNGEPDKQICIATVEGAHAAECSAVYDGATPGAVFKGLRMAEAGLLKPETARVLEARYHVRIKGADPSWSGWGANQWRGQTVAVASTTSAAVAAREGQTMEFEEQIRELLALGPDADALAAIRAIKERADAGETALRAIRQTVKALGAPDDADAGKWAAGEIERLRPLADDGKRYRDDLIEDALKEYVRAKGTEAKTEVYRGILGRSSLDEIKAMREDWAERGAANFPGGRQTGDGDSGGAPVNLDARRKPAKRAYGGV